MIVFYKNKFLDDKDVKISIYSPGFQYGMGFFTSLKIINGNPQFLDYHLERLYHSCNVYKIDFKSLNVKNILNKLLLKNEIEEARIKIIIYMDSDNKGKFLIIPQKLEINKTPKSLKSIQVNRENISIYKHKSLNYIENITLKNESIKSEFDDFLLINSRGMILEATTSNVFFLKRGNLFTPPLNMPILNGVIRKVILESEAINTYEKPISIQDLEEYEGCFLTNSVMGIGPVKSITLRKIRIVFNHKNLYNLPREILNL